MKAVSFEIQIPTKCTVLESNFRPHEKGDWCLSCQKTVVDFTGMSDADIIRFFQDKPVGESNCGRWRNDQLNKSYRPNPVHQKSSGWWPVLVGSVLSVVSVGKSNGQATDPMTWNPVPTETNAASEDSSDVPNAPFSKMIDIVDRENVPVGFRKISVRLNAFPISNTYAIKYPRGFCRETNESFTVENDGDFKIIVPISDETKTYTIYIYSSERGSENVYYLKIRPNWSSYI